MDSLKDKIQSKFDLASFSRTQQDMVAVNESAWDPLYSYNRFRKRTREYTIDDIDNIINSGSLEAQRTLSRNYFYKDGFYKRILMYYATLLKYVGILIPNPKPTKSLSDQQIQRRYHEAMNFVENLSLPVLLTHFAEKSLIDGAYYGIKIQIDKKRIAFLDLPAKYCSSTFKDFLGNPLVNFDVSYFNSITNEEAKKKALNAYPKVISKYYRLYINGKVKSSILTLPSDIGICFSFIEGDNPLFLNVIPATIQYDEAVETERERDLEEIRKIIVQQIPHLNDGGLLFEPEEAAEIHKGTVGMMKQNKNVSVLTTYANVDSIVSKTTSDAVSNNLEKMIQNIYNESGVSSQLFSATGNLSIETSIKNDTAFMMILGNKFSSFLTNTINNFFANSNVDFKYTILPITYYNESSYISDSFKLAQSGYSFILPSLALGFSQRDLNNVKGLENSILQLGDKLKPLSSAYTQSGSSSESGAPKKEADEKAPTTLEKEQSLDNQGGSN